jgi:translocation protein SEC63
MNIEQTQVLLQLPVLLNAFLNVAISRNWLIPTLVIMRLHTYLAQALPPVENARARLTQLPSIQSKDVDQLSDAKTLTDVAEALESKQDDRASDVKKALQQWGSLEIVDAAFKGSSHLFSVLNEREFIRIFFPSSYW